MTRSSAISLAAAAALALLFAVLAATRAAAVAPARPGPLPALAAPTAAPPRPTAERCITGAGDAVAAVGLPYLSAGRVDPAALAVIANRAFTADRTAERLRAAPAWPPRMGAGATATRTCVPE